MGGRGSKKNPRIGKTSSNILKIGMGATDKLPTNTKLSPTTRICLLTFCKFEYLYFWKCFEPYVRYSQHEKAKKCANTVKRFVKVDDR
jgi:hypothetical protein